MNKLAQELLIPDSVNWNFANSSNTVALTESQLIYASNKKIVVLCQKTGACTHLIYNKTSASVLFVVCNDQFIASYSSDNKIRLYDQGKFQELKSLDVPGCLGLKFRGNDLVCVSKDWCKVFNDGVLLSEHKLDGFFCIETHNELIAISQNSQTLVSKFLQTFIVPCQFSSMALQSSEHIYLAGFTSISIKVFEDSQEIAEIPLKKTQVKMKNPVYSIVWLNNNRLVYSTLPGELILVQVRPLVTQGFMNNPHTKAILSLNFSRFGLFSCGMDRFICCWDISEIDTSVKCPRSYATALAYTEPIWELQTIEASVHAMAICDEKLIFSCGKPTLQLINLSSPNMHSRPLSRITGSNITQTKLSPNKEILALITLTDLIFYSLAQEKVLSSIKSSFGNICWTSNDSLIGYSNSKVFRISVQGSADDVGDSKFEISSLTCHEDQVFIGTIEGNVFGYEINSWKRTLVSVVHSRKVTCLDYGPALVAGSEDGCLSVYWQNTLLIEKHYKAVLDVVWVGEWVVSGSLDHTVQVWDAVSGSPLFNFRDFFGAVRVILLYNSEQKVLITASDDQCIRIFSVLKSTDVCSPPKFSGNHKNEVVKTLFTELHKFIYQQTKESAYSSILTILRQEKTVESCIFLLRFIENYEIAEIFNINEVKIWLKIAEKKHEPDLVQCVPENLLEFSFLLGTSSLVSYSEMKAEDSLLKRKIHNCAIWHLLSNKPEESINLYISHKLYIEALIICKLFGIDNAIVLNTWAKRFLSTNKKEQAIKCYIAQEDYKSSLALLDSIQSTPETSEIRSLLLLKTNKQ